MAPCAKVLVLIVIDWHYSLNIVLFRGVMAEYESTIQKLIGKCS